MDKSGNDFRMPPALRNQSGAYRSVGFELEFTGLSIQQAGEALKSALSGKLHEESVAVSVLHVDGLGKFKIELDWNYLKTKAAAENMEEPSQWLDLLSQSAAMLVPVEIVCPPVPVNELDRLNPMVASLREAGAVGTQDSMLAAYGVHINAEIPHLDAATIFSFLRAFALLQWWLVEEHKVDFTRKLSPYIDLYPEAYLKHLFGCTEPTMEQLCNDYLEHNSSRNRALDMLPLLAEIDADRVSKAVGDDKTQARPAFHYRLPNCQIEKPDWSLAKAWNIWWVVEQLAAQKETLDTLSAKFLSMERPLLGVSRSDWTELMDQWLRDHVSA